MGADLVVGCCSSRTPGGGLAPTAAISPAAGEGAAQRLTVPGIGGECGLHPGKQPPAAAQGLFLAPHTVAQAVRASVFAARVMELLGYETEPRSSAVRHDIIQMIHTREPEALEKVLQGHPVRRSGGLLCRPRSPGICRAMAGRRRGPLSRGPPSALADAPMRPPYTVYLQGGLTFRSGKLGVLLAAEELLRA